MALLLDAPGGGRQVSVDNDSSFKDDTHIASPDIHYVSEVMEPTLAPCSLATGLKKLPRFPGLDPAQANERCATRHGLQLNGLTERNRGGIAAPVS
jgi:hypothetical protein